MSRREYWGNLPFCPRGRFGTPSLDLSLRGLEVCPRGGKGGLKLLDLQAGLLQLGLRGRLACWSLSMVYQNLLKVRDLPNSHPST